jgi:cobyrinic acid a,c-diamide synthase
MAIKMPSLVIAGLSGDSGKTIVSLSLLTGLRRKGLSISVFKKGPDYIDSAWLGKAANSICRNLDTYLVEPDDVCRIFTMNSAGADIALIEGNRGLFDGKDVFGTHSTAAIARLLGAPVVLVVDTTKVTRTVAATIKGCLEFEPNVNIAGIILNKVAGERHKKIITDSINKYCNLPILGAIPKLKSKSTIIPGRHLGLVPPSELNPGSTLENTLADIADRYLDMDGLLKIAQSAEPIETPREHSSIETSTKVNIGYFSDSVFTFYYPENLEALERNGARLVPVSSIEDKQLPDIDALYIGGGFPETQADKLANNKSMLSSVKKAAENGMPIYAECGGLIYLSKSIKWGENCYPMAGLFPINLTMHTKPVGHGYTLLKVDRPNPYYEVGSIIKGHEFHYSGLLDIQERLKSCMAVQSGFGLGDGRDGLVYKNTLACYTHIHADGVRNWASAVNTNALRYKNSHQGGTIENYSNRIREEIAVA